MNRGVRILLAGAACAALAVGAVPKRKPAPPAAVNGVAAVATVNGEPIDQRDFNALVQTYIQMSKAQAEQAKQKFGRTEEHNVAANVLGGLINDRLWVQEARRNHLTVPDSAVDSRIKTDRFFLTNGKFDATKWEAFKSSPQSNYKDVFRRAHDIVMVDKLRELLDRRFAPDDKKLLDEYLKQNQRHRVKYLWVREDKDLLTGAPDRAEVEAYYKSHPEEFRVPEKIDLVFACYRVGTPHDTSWEQSRVHAESLLVRLRQGVTLDSVSAQGAANLNTGLVERGDKVAILQHDASLTDSLFLLAPHEPYGKVVLGKEGYGVLVLNIRREAFVRPLPEAWASCYRSALLVYRNRQDEQAISDMYLKHLDRYHQLSARAKVLYFDPRTFAPSTRPSRDVLQRMYQEHLAQFSAPDSTGKPQPRAFAAVESLVALAYPDWMGDSLATLAWRAAYEQAVKGKDVFARPPDGALAREFLHVLSTSDDSLLTPTIVDSMLAAPPGKVAHLPSAVRGHLVYQVVERDTAYLPPKDAIRDRLKQDVAAERNAVREGLAQRYYAAHPDQFMGGEQYVLRYFLLPLLDVSQLHISQDDIQAYYDAHAAEYGTPARVRLSVVVFNLRPDAKPEDIRRVQARADSVAALMRKGEDFASLAMRFSDDQRTGATGGDVGYLTKATLRDTAVARVAFAMKAGDTAGPVRGFRGLYLLRCTEANPEVITPLDQVKPKVLQALSLAQSDSLTRKQAQEILARSRTRDALQQEADKVTSAMSATEPFELGEEIPTLGQLTEVQQALPKMQPGEVGRTPAKTFGGYVVWMLDQKLPSRPRSFQKAHQQVLDAMDKDSLQVLMRARVDTLEARLKHSSDLAEVGYDLGTVRESDPFVRGYFISGLGPASIVDTFLVRAKPGDISGVVPHPSGGCVVVQYLGGDPLDRKDFEQKKGRLRDSLLQGPESELLASIRRKARVQIFRPDLKDAWNPRPPTAAGPQP
ncbi:MAG TPA: peptidylprolyl isomerase [Candidatus Saccharimonadales bacterium]|nr:peptidylprolyl isomerase [Candidatus Saccharimonadales bacterium]